MRKRFRELFFAALTLTAWRAEAIELAPNPAGSINRVERVFDPDAFTAWYIQQLGLTNQAFAEN